MHAFRAAHRDRDATVKVDIRHQGDRVIASRRLMARAPIPETELRKTVNTELVALFNTTNLEAIEDLSTAPEVRKSIINFGFPSSLAERSTRTKSAGFAREIETALRDFEPRLVRGSIKARRDETVSAGRAEGEISGQRRAQDAPVEVPVQFVAEVELELR